MPSGFGRMLSLHYYSNIAKDLLPTANEEVYPLYAIKDWNEISLHWVDTFYQKENVRGMLNINNYLCVWGREKYFLVCFGQKFWTFYGRNFTLVALQLQKFMF